jgi:excisionase family DNA binding protein
MGKNRWNGRVRIRGQIRVTTARAAQLLGIPQDTIRRFCDEKRIPFVRHPKHGYRLILMSVVRRKSSIKRKYKYTRASKE